MVYITAKTPLLTQMPALYQPGTVIFGKWRAYKAIKRFNLTDHQKVCKGQAVMRGQQAQKTHNLHTDSYKYLFFIFYVLCRALSVLQFS